MMTERAPEWGRAASVWQRARGASWVDGAILATVAGLVYAIIALARRWMGELRPAVAIDLSPWALPKYTLLSLSRGLIAYLLSLAFAIGYGTWAAKDRTARRPLILLLDVLQSIPVLGFMPGLVLGLVAAFPRSNAGLELAAVLMMFTAQAWNMAFSVFHSLRTIPADLDEAARAYRFTRVRRLMRLELPCAAIGLTWNSMMSMAGGWFFLMINEAFVLGDRDFRLPGLGSYMSVAVAAGDARAMIAALLAMTAMIVALDQLLWRPLIAWSQRFRLEESAAPPLRSWFLDLLHRSRLLAQLLSRGEGPDGGRLARAQNPRSLSIGPSAEAWLRRIARAARLVLLTAAVAILGYGALALASLLAPVPARDWLATVLAAAATLARVLGSTALATLWTVPAGLAIGLSARWSRRLSSPLQIAASFPAPMLFPAAILVLTRLHVGLSLGAVALMLFGTQWYVLFNVVAGATAIPADLREAARAFRLGAWSRLRTLYVPAILPYLVTGWITAAGGAWNASIVAEYVSFRGRTLATTGIGAVISRAAADARFPALAAGLFVMSAMVVVVSRLVWQPLQSLAERRFSLSR